MARISFEAKPHSRVAGCLALLLVYPILFLMINPAPAQDAQPTPPDYGQKFLGNIMGKTLHPDFLQYWNQLTSENQGKWGSVERERDVMDWELLDTHYNFAKEHGIPFKFHVLVWGSQQPKWMEELPEEEQLEEVKEWIALVLDRYPGLDMIDVLNEPITIPAGYREALGGKGRTGWDWVITVFEIVREHQPDAVLILNEHSTLKKAEKRERFIEIIKLLQERDLIDAVGLQAHFLEYGEVEELSAALEEYAALGLPIYISEFDLDLEDDQQQLERMKELFPLFWNHPQVQGVTLWGYKEGQMWRKKGHLVREDGTLRPAMQWLLDYVRDQP